MQFYSSSKARNHLDYLKPQPHLHQGHTDQSDREKPKNENPSTPGGLRDALRFFPRTLANLRVARCPPHPWRRLHPLYGAHFAERAAGWHEFHSPMALSVSLSQLHFLASSRIAAKRSRRAETSAIPLRNAALTMRSSREWNEIITIRPPGEAFHNRSPRTARVAAILDSQRFAVLGKPASPDGDRPGENSLH